MDRHRGLVDDYAFVKDYPKAENGRLSVSAWVRAVSLDYWGSIISNWYCMRPHLPIGQFGLSLGNDLELSAQIRQRDGRMVATRERNLPLPRGVWHHVAFVADGKVLRLYRNGVEVDAAAYDGIICDHAVEHLSIGAGMNASCTAPRPGNSCVWDGQIDEVAVFNHALSREEIGDLFRGKKKAAADERAPRANMRNRPVGADARIAEPHSRQDNVGL